MPPHHIDDILHDIGLLAISESAAFDTLTRLASEMVGAPVTLVSIVMPDEDRQFFKSMNGLPEPWASRRQTPLSHSFCQHVRASNRPLIISDARKDDLVSANGAVADLGVIAYAGFPIHSPEGNAIGAFCAIDGKVRDWTQDELRIIADFAAVADDQIRLLAAMHDRARTLAAEREAAAAKSRLFANVSHEVRTPLGGILGLAELLLDEVSDPVHREILATIRTAGGTLLHILDDLLDMAKVDAGKLRLESEVFNLCDVVTSAVALHRPAAASKGIKLLIEIAGDLPQTVIGDQYRLQQILNNLLSNAVKFTPLGKVQLAVSIDERQEETLSFAISDSGIGLTVDQRSRLFIPFEQGDGSTTRLFGGTGLGTSIVARLTELMGGTISVESEAGRGSTFTVLLPFARPVAITDTAPEVEIAVPDIQLDGLRVLVADDNATNRKLLNVFLTRAGADVRLVEDGSLAVSSAMAEDYDAILLDISMPVLDGIGAIQQIQAFCTQLKKPMPITIAITANAMPEDMARYLNYGFTSVVSKPFSRRELIQTIREKVNTATLHCAHPHSESRAAHA